MQVTPDEAYFLYGPVIVPSQPPESKFHRDAEIVSIANLIRLEPGTGSNGRAASATPILSVNKDSGEWATVQLDPGTQPKPGNVARVILHRVNNLWTWDHLVIGQA